LLRLTTRHLVPARLQFQQIHQPARHPAWRTGLGVNIVASPDSTQDTVRVTYNGLTVQSTSATDQETGYVSLE